MPEMSQVWQFVGFYGAQMLIQIWARIERWGHNSQFENQGHGYGYDYH